MKRLLLLTIAAGLCWTQPVYCRGTRTGTKRIPAPKPPKQPKVHSRVIW